ncbi:MAG: hypothetical protein VX265_18560 [Myxococcota bacterium]|nr:hypothetical protein [Myxococcota bacterium]MEC8425702.1 hypothetical protein [Myxococcota bacterium]
MASQTAVGAGAALSIVGIVAAGTLAISGSPRPAAELDPTPGGEPLAATVEREPSGIPQCDAYRSLPGEAFGYCLYKIAGGLPDVASVNRVCGLAEDWEGECRHAWVAGKMNADSSFSMETLLEVCDKNADCSFELLDFRPSDLIDTQLERCRLYAGKHAADCTGHAMQRWKLQGVDEEEVARVAAQPSAFPRKVGFWLAASVECDSIGACDGNAAVQDACERQVEAFARKPEQCPSKVKAPLQRGKTAAGPREARAQGRPGNGSVGGVVGGGGVAGGGAVVPSPPTPGPAPAGEPKSQRGPGSQRGGKPGGGAATKRSPPVRHTPGTIPAGLPPRSD